MQGQELRQELVVAERKGVTEDNQGCTKFLLCRLSIPVRLVRGGKREGKMDIPLRCGTTAPTEHRELCVFDVAGRPAVRKHARHVLFAAIQIASAGNVTTL